MKKVCLLLAAFMMISCLSFQMPISAETNVLTEDFEDGSCNIKNATTHAVLDNIVNAATGDERYGKVFKTSASTTNTWYVDLGKTFMKEDNNVAKISFDVKTPSTASVLMFFLGDSEKLSSIEYTKVNTSYQKKLMYFRDTGVSGVFTDSSGSANWPTSGTAKSYTTGTWLHFDVIIDMYKQTATIKLGGEDWTTLSYSDSVFESFNFLGVKSEKKSGSIWYLDNLTVTDQTVEVDETVLFEANFENVEKATSTGISFEGGRGDSNDAVETGYGDKYNKVFRFDTSATEAAWILIPVNASEVSGKNISISFDMYAGASDGHECMIQLHNGTEYHKILVMNGSGAHGKLGYYKFPDPDIKVWAPAGSQAIDDERWVHVDGIIEFRENQTVLKWYFNGVYSGLTYSFDIKQLNKLRFRTERVTDTTVTTRRFALDNILIRQYENNKFETKAQLKGEGVGTTLEITPKSNLSKDFSAENCSFEIVNSQTGAVATVASKEYKDGKILLKLSGLEYSQLYTVTSSDFCDIYGQKMNSFEFSSNPQYDASNAVVPQIKAVWFYDHDGNRLTANQVTTEVNKMEILFNTRIKSSTVTEISLGDLTLEGEYSSKNNSYTATWDGYLAPNTSYPLSITGIIDVNGKAMADYNKTITTGNGKVSVKSIELINSAGEKATATDIVEGAVLTAKLNVLNTTGEAVDGILAYGIYKDSYMTDNDFTTHYLENGMVTEVDMEIPYADSDANLKVFMWDEFSKLNAYFQSFDFQTEE